jgi:hypothetical protein
MDMKPGLIGITFFLSLVRLAHATTMIPLDLKALADRADRVVYGTVESTEAHWTTDHDAIYTDAVVRVTKAYKGGVKAGETVVVRREGGTVDGIGMKVFGAAVLTPGEEVVLFVEQRGIASYVVGMAQGKLRVATLADGSKRVTAPDVSGIAFLHGTAPVQPMRARPLEDFERDLKALVNVKGVK